MKKEKIFFHPIEGSGPLSISWSSEPKGSAVEAQQGLGVGFFSKTGKLLCVIFDDVEADQDHQILEFSHDRIEVTVRSGRVRCSLNRHPLTSPRKISRKSHLKYLLQCVSR
jgi:hypothetical protein